MPPVVVCDAPGLHSLWRLDLAQKTRNEWDRRQGRQEFCFIPVGVEESYPQERPPEPERRMSDIGATHERGHCTPRPGHPELGVAPVRRLTDAAPERRQGGVRVTPA